MKTKMMIAAVAAATLVSGAALAAGKGDNVMSKLKDGSYVVNTTTIASNVRGYHGATPLEVYIKKNKAV